MLGGGTFTVQNKILNGAYINFVSVNKANATLSDRGVATMPLELDWGADDVVFKVTQEDFQKHSLKIFGYPYNHEKLMGLRDLFINTQILYAYRLNSGGIKASNTFATAKCSGVRGNDIKIVISANVDSPSNFDVKVYMGNTIVDEQFDINTMADLKSNDYVDWKSDATLAVNIGLSLTGGTNGEVDGNSHQTYLTRIEPYTYNTMGVPFDVEDATKLLYAAFTKRMRDQQGAKFQCVLYNHDANYEGVINVCTLTSNDNQASLVYWVTGAEAGCPVNQTLTNRKYDGEFTFNAYASKETLEWAMTYGEFRFHVVGDEKRVLADINSFIVETDDKSVEIFGDNQCIRVMDQIANDIAVIFNTKYLGKVPNDASGRISLWNDIVKHHQQLQAIRAIQDFEPDDITVNQGDAKNSVVVGDAVTITVGMAKLYMTVTVQ